MAQFQKAKSHIELKKVLITIFTEKVKELDNHQLKLKIPGPQPQRKIWKGYDYHFEPEIFIQISGSTEFSFIDEKILLGPGEICIVPSFTPHAEKAKDGKKSFFNYVFGFSSRMITFHSATRIGNRPHGELPNTISTPEAPKISQYVTEAVEFYKKNNPEYQRSIDALMLLFFEKIRLLLLQAPPKFKNQNTLIENCKDLVQSKLTSRNLSVARLADWLGCSANYLSWVFSQTEKEKLSSYISNMRLNQVKSLLQTTTMNVKQIALACGYDDPAYCIRVFKNKFGITPKKSRTKTKEKNDIE